MTPTEIQEAFDELCKKYFLALKKLQEAYLLLEEKPKEVVVEKEVPVERIVVRTDNSRIEELERLNTKLRQVIADMEKKSPEVVEKAASGDLKDAARYMAQSDLNKEDLSEDEIFKILSTKSEEEVRAKLGFWAVPLPTNDTDTDNKPRYTVKK